VGFDSIANISGVHSAFIFKAEVGKCSCIYKFCSNRPELHLKVWLNTHSTYLNLEDGDRTCLRNIGNTANVSTMWRPNNIFKISNELQRKFKMSRQFRHSLQVRFTDHGKRQRSWLRYYTTNRNVAGSIPDEVIGFFNWPNPSSRTVSLLSTEPLTHMSTRNIPGGKGRPGRQADNLAAICEPIV
jgi:hypothetical protein